MNNLIDLYKKRHSQYALDRNVNFTNEEIQKLVEDVLNTVPSAMNSQSQRAVLALGNHHDKVWDIVELKLNEVTGGIEDSTKQKLEGFRNAYGTILIYKDNSVTKNLEESYPLYAENFPKWAWQESGYFQYGLWLSLVENGLGANLQHYNPLIDFEIKKYFNVPENWELVAQMVFGNVVEDTGNPERDDVNKKLIVK